MAETKDARLAAVLRELEKQDANWARVKEELRALGDVVIAVPTAALEEITDACRVHTPNEINLQAVRG